MTEPSAESGDSSLDSVDSGDNNAENIELTAGSEDESSINQDGEANINEDMAALSEDEPVMLMAASNESGEVFTDSGFSGVTITKEADGEYTINVTSSATSLWKIGYLFYLGIIC